MKIVVPAEKLATAVMKHLAPALKRLSPEEIQQMAEEIRRSKVEEKR